MHGKLPRLGNTAMHSVIIRMISIRAICGEPRNVWPVRAAKATNLKRGWMES